MATDNKLYDIQGTWKVLLWKHYIMYCKDVCQWESRRCCWEQRRRVCWLFVHCWSRRLFTLTRAAMTWEVERNEACGRGRAWDFLLRIWPNAIDGIIDSVWVLTYFMLTSLELRIDMTSLLVMNNVMSRWVIPDHCQPCPRTVSRSLGDRCTTSVLRWLSTSAVKHLCLCPWTMTKTTRSGLSVMHRYLVWVQCTVKDRRGKPAGQQVSCHVNSQMHKDTTVSLSKRRSRYLRHYSSGKTN